MLEIASGNAANACAIVVHGRDNPRYVSGVVGDDYFRVSHGVLYGIVVLVVQILFQVGMVEVDPSVNY